MNLRVSFDQSISRLGPADEAEHVDFASAHHCTASYPPTTGHEIDDSGWEVPGEGLHGQQVNEAADRR